MAGCFSLAFSTSGDAALVLAPLEVPTITNSTYFTVDLDTEAFMVGGNVSGYDFTIYTDGAGTPYLIFGSNVNNAIFCLTSFNVGLLGTGVTVDSSLVSGNPGSSFRQDAYFTPAPGAGTHYVGFQTNSDLDGNPLTTGLTYGFFQIEVGSLTVNGYGFESVPGDGAVTTPVPEPLAGTLLVTALGALLVRRRHAGR